MKTLIEIAKTFSNNLILIVILTLLIFPKAGFGKSDELNTLIQKLNSEVAGTISEDNSETVFFFTGNEIKITEKGSTYAVTRKWKEIESIGTINPRHIFFKFRKTSAIDPGLACEIVHKNSFIVYKDEIKLLPTIKRVLELKKIEVREITEAELKKGDYINFFGFSKVIEQKKRDRKDFFETALIVVFGVSLATFAVLGSL